jgi:hypothetical protein
MPKLNLSKAINNLNNLFNTLTDYDVVLAKKQQMVTKEDELVKAKQRFLEAKRQSQDISVQLKDIKKDFDTQKEANNIALMSKLYEKRLLLQEDETKVKSEESLRWNDFESLQLEYFTLARQLAQEENIYIYRVRRLGLVYNWIFISVHFIVFLVVQWNERRKRDLMLGEIKALKSDLMPNLPLINDADVVGLAVETAPEQARLEQDNQMMAQLVSENQWLKGLAVGSITGTLALSFLILIK